MDDLAQDFIRRGAHADDEGAEQSEEEEMGSSTSIKRRGLDF